MTLRVLSVVWSASLALAIGCGSVSTEPDASRADAAVPVPDASLACGGGCDDSDLCTTDTCANNTCMHAAVSCDDGDGCTADSCSPLGGCAYVPIATPGAVTFAYSGGVQSFTVPACISSITVDAYGAAGGAGTAVGGAGGRATATVPVTPGELLFVYVGGEGPTTSGTLTSGGFNGGGGTILVSTMAPSGTGGGASDVRRGTALTGRLVVAGGGGGGGWSNYNGFGGSGGGLLGNPGNSNNATFVAGSGGTQVAGGAAGWVGAGYPNEPGSFGLGGTSYHDGAGCGGGGGGWYGGGTGGFAGGGGGSSYVDAPGNTNGSTQTGVNAGNGSVLISW